jgi:hypothetical protein
LSGAFLASDTARAVFPLGERYRYRYGWKVHPIAMDLTRPERHATRHGSAA